MCVNSISVSCDDVERLCIIDCSREVEPDFTPQRMAFRSLDNQLGRMLRWFCGAREILCVLGRVFLDGKTWPGFFFPVLLGIARGGGGPRKQRSSRPVCFVTHVKSCVCWGRFILSG